MGRRTLGVVLTLLLLEVAGCGGSSAPAGPVSPNTSGWWRDKVVYQVFVRSFADSDGDGIGDLSGLTARLDDLNDGNPATTSDLGVDALWLMPIFESPSYHGYDVTDYRAIEADYGGSLAEFDAFVAAAHARGIKVILDMVLNHSSDRHPWFVDSQTGADAARRRWYVWSATDPGWGSPLGGAPPWRPAATGWYYAAFSGSMPDLNLGEPAVEAELVDVMNGWLSRGVDGFRLDAVRYLVANGSTQQVDQPESHAFLKRVRAALHAQHPQALLVAEAWANTETVATYYGAGDEVQLAFSFDQADAIRASLLGGTSSSLVNTLARAEAALAGKDRGFEAPFLSNHDQVREARSLLGDLPSLRLAAATLMALPGTPFVYYGEELGMQGGAGADDRNKRTPYRWDATTPGYGFTTGTPWFTAPEADGIDLTTARADPGSLWHLYRSLIALRHARPALASGDATRPAVTGGGAAAFALLRTAGGARVLFVANFSAAPIGAFSVTAGGAPAVLASEGLAGPPAAVGGLVTVPGLAARGWSFLALE